MLFFFKLEAHNHVSKDILSRFRLYLARPSGLRKDIGSIGAILHVLFFRWLFLSFKVSKFQVSSFKVSSFKFQVSKFQVSKFQVSKFQVSSFKFQSCKVFEFLNLCEFVLICGKKKLKLILKLNCELRFPPCKVSKIV